MLDLNKEELELLAEQVWGYIKRHEEWIKFYPNSIEVPEYKKRIDKATDLHMKLQKEIITKKKTKQ